MTTQAVSRDLLMPQDPGGSRRGIALSVLVHIGLVVAIAFGLNWRSRVPEAQQAELWAAVPQAAAPREVEPVVQPAPPPPPAPAPVVQPEPKVVEPPKPTPAPDAQIAIEQARKKEEERKARELEEQERKAKLAAEREAQKKKLALEKAEKAAKAEKAEKAAKAERERLEKQAAEKKKLQDALEAQQAKQREAARADQLKRIQGMAGASGGPGATGTALRSAGPSAGYAGLIKAKVRPKILFGDQVAGNPTAEVEVRAAPDGTIIGRRLVKSSGIPAYDEAVLRAIDKTEVLPRDTQGDGRVPPILLLVFRPNE
jgi:colicin import membrane protein